MTAVILTLTLLAAPGLDSAWNHWKAGRVLEAQAEARAVDGAGDEARSLLMLTAYVTGRYEEALAEYERLTPECPRRPQLTPLAIQALIRLNRLEDAVRLAHKTNQPAVSIARLEARRLKPLEVSLRKTTIAPFVAADRLAGLMPAIAVEVNGKPVTAHLDTGGAFLAASEPMAGKLGVETAAAGTGEANAQQTALRAGMVNELRIGDAVLRNVPLATAASLNRTGETLIIGTNILERFLTTWDNPGKRLILSPRRDSSARKEHFGLIPPGAAEVPFFLQGDHFLFVRGGVGERKDLVFFLDTGLVTLDPQGRQPAMAIAPATAAAWGLDAAGKKFVESPGAISLGPVSATGHSLFLLNMGKGIPWQGMEVAGVLAHGFLKNYAWTLDFDAMKLYMAGASATTPPSPGPAANRR